MELVQQPKFKSASRLWLRLLRGYFRIEVEGLEHLPKKGRALIAPNHSGFAGADAVLLAYVLKLKTRRRARILAHRAFFDFSRTLKAVSQSFGLKKASIQGGVDILKEDHLMIIFPEGETGNFKPTYRRYELQRFHTGFLRMAIEAQAPVIPCVIVGAEESHLNLGNLDFSKFVRGLRIPLPLNFIPLPAKWRIIFLPPVSFGAGDATLLENAEAMKKRAATLQREMQRELRERLRKREYIYFRETRAMADSMLDRLSRLQREARRTRGRWLSRSGPARTVRSFRRAVGRVARLP